MGWPPPVRAAREMAAVIIRQRHSIFDESNTEPRVGVNWATAFYKRHEQLRVTAMKAMEWDRASHTIYDKLVAWYQLYDTTMANPDILPTNVYNMDETGFMLGMLKSLRVLTAANDKRQHRAAPQDRELVTAVECISVDGSRLSPMIIMKAKSHRDAWYSHDGTKNWLFAYSKNGYTDYELSYQWLTRIFQPETLNKAMGKPRVLISDGLLAHESIEFMTFCFENNIILMRLPSHTSHVTQPLDVSCFSPLKAYYRVEAEKLFRGGSMIVTKRHFTWLYHTARQKAFSKCNIESAWMKSGLHPFNPSLVLSKEAPESYGIASLTQPITPPSLRDPTRGHPNPHSPIANMAPVTTPRTSQQLDDLSTSIHSSFDTDKIIDTPCKKRVTKLIHAAQSSFAERSLLMDENRLLFRQNCEKQQRQSHGMATVGAGRVLSYEDIVAARERKERSNQGSNKRKRAQEDSAGADDADASGVVEPWQAWTSVIEF
jgi:hypothetical protein